jgi:hypothetical protein
MERESFIATRTAPEAVSKAFAAVGARSLPSQDHFNDQMAADVAVIPRRSLGGKAVYTAEQKAIAAALAADEPSPIVKGHEYSSMVGIMSEQMPLTRVIARAHTGDPAAMMRECIGSGHWCQYKTPPGTTRHDIAEQIWNVMSEAYPPGPGGRTNGPQALADGAADDPLCELFGVPMAERDRLIAFAGRAVNAHDSRMWLAPPSTSTPFTRGERITYVARQVWVIHGSDMPMHTRHPGLKNLKMPHYCVRADLDAVLPDLDQANMMIGLPWATMSIIESKDGEMDFNVYKPESGKHKTVRINLQVDPVPEWLYQPTAIHRILEEIHFNKRHAKLQTTIAGKRIGN